MGKPQQVKATADEIAAKDVGTQQMADWLQRWQPVLTNFGEDMTKALAPDSYERRHAETLAATDTAAKFGQAQEAALDITAQNRTMGSAKQKLGITGMTQDQATSGAFGATAADQSVTDAALQGIGTVAAAGRGNRAIAFGGMQRNAAMSGAQAAADAEASLQNRIGNVSLASKIIGAGAGTWMGQPTQPPAAAGGTLASGWVGPDGATYNNPSAWTARPGG